MSERPPQTHSNQHLKRKRAIRDAEYIRNKIRAGVLINRLNKAAAGKLELSKAQVDATKILLDKAMPSLQAVEQTTKNEWDSMSQEEMITLVKALITAHPELLKLFAPGPQPVEAVDNTVERSAA